MNNKKTFSRILLSIVTFVIFYLSFKQDINNGEINDAFMCIWIIFGVIFCWKDLHQGSIEALENRIKELEKKLKDKQ